MNAQQTYPDVIKAGEVMATLNDWRAILFVMMFIIIVLVLTIIGILWGVRTERREMRTERERMWLVADKFGEAADRVGVSLAKVSEEIAVLRFVSSRVEQTAGERRDAK